MIVSHEENVNNARVLLDVQEKYKEYRVTLKLFRDEGWVFRKSLPDTSSSFIMFPVHEAIINNHLKIFKPSAACHFDRLLGTVKLLYKIKTNNSCELVVNDLQAAVVLHVQNKVTISVEDLLEFFKAFNKDDLLRKQIDLLVSLCNIQTSGEHPLLLKKPTDEFYMINQELAPSSSEPIVYTVPIDLKKNVEIAVSDDLTTRIECYLVRKMKMFK